MILKNVMGHPQFQLLRQSLDIITDIIGKFGCPLSFFDEPNHVFDPDP